MRTRIWDLLGWMLTWRLRRRRPSPAETIDPQLLQAAPAALPPEKVRALAIRCLRAERQVLLARAMIHHIVPILQTLGHDGYVEAEDSSNARDWLVTAQQIGLIAMRSGEFRQVKLTANGRE